jgi:hypothetical protein
VPFLPHRHKFCFRDEQQAEEKNEDLPRGGVRRRVPVSYGSEGGREGGKATAKR